MVRYEQLQTLGGAKRLKETIGKVSPLFPEFKTLIKLQKVKDQVHSFGKICSAIKSFQLDGKCSCFFMELKSNLSELFYPTSKEQAPKSNTLQWKLIPGRTAGEC